MDFKRDEWRGASNHSTAYTHVHRSSAINGDPKAMRYATRIGVNNEPQDQHMSASNDVNR